MADLVFPVSGDTGEERDTAVNGHTYSPALREAEREILAVKTRVHGLSAMGQAELDAMMATGHAKLDSTGRASAREALECFAASYAMARAIESTRGELDALSAAALCYRELGRPEVAVQMWRGCIALSAQHGDHQGHAHALGNAGLALRALGQLEEAVVLQRLSARAALGCGDWACAVRAHVNLANLLLDEDALLAGAPAERAGPEAATPSDADAPPESPVPSEDPERHLRTALELLDAHADDAPTAAAASELEMTVCMRLAALRGAAAASDASEVAALYLRALEAAVTLGDAQPEASQRAARFRQIASVLEGRIALLGFGCVDSLSSTRSNDE